MNPSLHFGFLQVFLIALIILSMSAIWHMDVALGAMLADGVVTNGWSAFTPLQTYHIALYAQLLSLFLMATLAAYGMSGHDNVPH